jgi:hypothetical protein
MKQASMHTPTSSALILVVSPLDSCHEEAYGDGGGSQKDPYLRKAAAAACCHQQMMAPVMLFVVPCTDPFAQQADKQQKQQPPQQQVHQSRGRTVLLGDVCDVQNKHPPPACLT